MGGMSAEKFDDSPKFDIDGTYSRDDFIFRLERLILTLPEGDSLVPVLRENIKWAEGLHPEAVIRWDQSDSGMIYPYVEYGFGILPSAGLGSGAEQ